MNKFAVYLAVLLLVALAPVAQGAIQLSYSTTGDAGKAACTAAGATDTFATCNPFSPVAGLTISGFSGSGNSPGSGTAEEFGSTVSIVNTGGAKTLILWVEAPNYMNPVTGGGVTGIRFDSNSSGTSTAGTSTITLKSCVDPDPLGGSPFCTEAGSVALTNDPITVTGSTGNDSDSQTIFFSPLAAPYWLTQRIEIALGAGARMNVTTSNILTAVPEPTSVALLGGILAVTGIALRRRSAVRT